MYTQAAQKKLEGINWRSVAVYHTVEVGYGDGGYATTARGQGKRAWKKAGGEHL